MENWGDESDQRDPDERDGCPAAGRWRGHLDLQWEIVGQLGLAGGVGTFSAVNAESYDASGQRIPQVYHGRTRRERHEELVASWVRVPLRRHGRPTRWQCGKGRIHANILWEMGAAERIITEVLERAKGLINGITCGAGMPYKLSDIAARFGVHYYPIVSSARTLNALWKPAYAGRVPGRGVGAVAAVDLGRVGLRVAALTQGSTMTDRDGSSRAAGERHGCERATAR